MKKQIIYAFALTAALGAAYPAVPAKAKWNADSNGRWYTYKGKSDYAVGWTKIGNFTYYFGKNKYAVTGWQLIENKWYYFDSKGRMVTDCWVDGYYFTADGSMAVSTTISTSVGVFSFDSNGNLIPGSAADSLAVPDSTATTNRWVEKNGKHYYYTYKGTLAKGWLIIKDKTYYMNPKTGARLTGWVKVNKKRYYFSPDTGQMITGWLKIKNKIFYLKPDGSTPSGWKKIDGERYYFNKNGKLVTNQIINGKYYVDENGQRASGFHQIKTHIYYFSEQTGKMMKGWQTIDGSKYYFNSSGKMVRDAWIGKRYLLSDGKMATKTWIGKYYLNKNGKRTKKTRSTGFWKYKKKTYYLDSDYQIVKNQWISSKGVYYYMGSNGVLATNQWVGNYYVGSNGKRITNQMLTIDNKTYLLKKDGTKSTGMVKYNKKTYLFDRNGVMVTGWYNNTVATFYFLPTTGEMVTNQIAVIDDVFYRFDKDGHMIDDETLNSDLATGEKIAAYALQFIGNPYVYGGTSLTNGADCSGFTQSVMAHFEINIPRVADQQARGTDGTNTKYAKAKVISIKNIKPGDLVFYYSPISHVGIYIGDGKIVHASNSSAYPVGGIKISPYDYATIRAIIRYW